jgi:hypothetical protein
MKTSFLMLTLWFNMQIPNFWFQHKINFKITRIKCFS